MLDSTGSEALAPLLLRLSHAGTDVTVRVCNPHAPGISGVHLHLSSGQLVDIVPEQPPSLLETAAVNSPSLRDRDRKKALKIAQAEGRDPGEVILREGLVAAEELADLIICAVADKVAEYLKLKEVEFEIVDPLLSIPVRRLSDLFQIAIPVESLLLTAAGTDGNWAAIRPYLPCLKEVWGARPSASQFLALQHEYVLECALIQQFDGTRDLAEAIEGTGEDPFLCFDVFQGLLAGDHLEPLNPVQLFQLGCEFEAAGDLEKALRLLERAEDRGLDDFDLGFRLGEIYQKTGRAERAEECFLAFADKCADQHRIEDTIRACRKILELKPDHRETRDRVVALLVRYGKGDEAVREAMSLARDLDADGEPVWAQRVLDKVVDLPEITEELLQLYLTVCRKSGHEPGVQRAQRQLGEHFHRREDVGKALELFRGMFESGDQTPEVRAKLTELYFRSGQPDTAREHLGHLSRLHGWTPRDATAGAVEFFHRLIQLGVRDPEVAGWLADEARIRGNRDDAIRFRELESQFYEAQEDLENARVAAEKLVALEPGHLEGTRRLASLELRSGNASRAGSVLEGLASQLAEEGENKGELNDVLHELIAVNPLSLQGRRLLIPQSRDAGNELEQHRLVLETALLRLVAGEHSRAEAMLEEIPAGDALRNAFALISAQLTAWHEDLEKAVLWFSKCAQAAAEGGDRATLRHSIDQLRELDPHHAELDAFEGAWQQLSDPAAARSRDRGAVIQTNVSNITARLKTLQSPTPAPATQVSSSKSNVDKLKALKSGSDTKPAPKTGGVKGVDALKSLRAGGAAPANDGEADSAADKTEMITPESGGEEIVKAIKGVDALKRLRGGGGTEPAAETPTSAESPTPDSESAEAPKSESSGKGKTRRGKRGGKGRSSKSGSAATGAAALKKLREGGEDASAGDGGDAPKGDDLEERLEASKQPKKLGKKKLGGAAAALKGLRQSTNG